MRTHVYAQLGDRRRGRVKQAGTPSHGAGFSLYGRTQSYRCYRSGQRACALQQPRQVALVLAAQFLALEQFLEQAIRSLHERAELCRMMSEKPPNQPEKLPDLGLWDAARTEALEQTQPLRDVPTREWIQPSQNRLLKPYTSDQLRTELRLLSTRAKARGA